MAALPCDAAPYRNLKDAHLKAREGVFIAEGVEVVRRLLASRLEVCSLLVTENKLAQLSDDLRPGVPVFVGTLAEIEAVAGFNVHRGALACGRRPENAAFADVTAIADPGQPSLVVALENVTDAINIGVIVRNAAAFGASLVLLHRCCDAFYRRAVRTSMGNVFRVPLRVTEDLPGDLERLHGEFGHTRVAAVTARDAADISTVRAPARAVLVFGAEGDGLSPTAVAACDERVTIPMSTGSDSVNVAVASGIFLHRYARGRATR
ncbi:MAG TPA: RNA methyltransferase [Phycisphaerae bacterium]|nr:RNA methyltransferase [Phycisphaerae bacterium]